MELEILTVEIFKGNRTKYESNPRCLFSSQIPLSLILGWAWSHTGPPGRGAWAGGGGRGPRRNHSRAMKKRPDINNADVMSNVTGNVIRLISLCVMRSLLLTRFLVLRETRLLSLPTSMD